MAIRLTTYKKGSIIPALPGNMLPHSTELFHVYEQTPGYSPILMVASEEERPIAKLLAVIRRSVRLFPPSIIKRCEIYGNGEYFDESYHKEEVFGLMLEHLTRDIIGNCFLIEIRNLDSSLFGYKHFRHNQYFPVNWIRVYNSLHSMPPLERLEPFCKRQINKAIKNGAYIQLAESEEEINIFLKILRRNYASKIRKHFPDLQLFRLLMTQYPEKEIANVFLVKYKGKIVGGSFCMYSGDSAYLCFSGGMRKTYAWLYPGVMAVWAAISHAYEKGYQHFEFADAGLPFKKVGYRNFILNFGGKQVSTRRWFRFRWNWLNKLLTILYR